jgi:hypothetical protein
MKPANSPAPERHEIPLFIRLGELPIGRTRNLSSNGIFLLTSERPPVGSVHELHLAWGTDVFSCTVRIVRHADDGIGLTFEDPDTLFKQAVNEILADQESGTD